MLLIDNIWQLIVEHIAVLLDDGLLAGSIGNSILPHFSFG
jgi:hypothetical protein